MTKDDILATIDALRERGATHVEVEGVRADFPPPDMPAIKGVPAMIPLVESPPDDESDEARETREWREALWSSDG